MKRIVKGFDGGVRFFKCEVACFCPESGEWSVGLACMERFSGV